MQYILSLSYGKDSLACLGAIEQLGWPLDRIIHAEVWATDTIPADLPPMMEFKKKADKIILDRWGIEVEHVCAMTTYEECFYKIPKKRKRNNTEFNGKCRGFPFQKGAWCQRDLKVNPLEKRQKKKTYEDVFYHERKKGNKKGQIYGFPIQGYPICNSELKRPVFKKVESKDSISYLGIAADEPNRFHDLNDQKKSPLVEAGWTEAMCREWCDKNDLLSPIYTTSARGGCWFCHNQGVGQLRILRHDYPDLWALLMKWDNDSPVTFKANGRTVHDFDRRFQMEDDGFIKPDEPWKWEYLDSNLINYRLF